MSENSEVFHIRQRESAALCAAAVKDMAQREFSEAREKLLQALNKRPSSALAFKLLGDLYVELGDNCKASVCYRNQLPSELCDAEKIDAVSDDHSQVSVFASEQWEAPKPGSVGGQPVFDAVQVTSSECFVDTVSHGTVWHDDLNTLVSDRSGAILPLHSVGCTDLVRQLRARHSPIRVDGRAILIGARGAHNFYHWSTDIFPKLLVLKAAGIELRSTDSIIVSRANAPYARQFLEILDLHPDQVIETESGSPYIGADELVVPYLNNKMGYGMGSWLPDNLRRIMGIDHAPNAGIRLFINRRPDTAAGRTLANSTACEEFFKEKGYEVVYPETMSVIEQAQLFSSADTIAGVHGAGLANILYCSPGTRVIEFYGAHIAPCYWLISALAGFDYYQHSCKVTNQSETNRHAAGLSLPIQEVETLLERIT